MAVLLRRRSEPDRLSDAFSRLLAREAAPAVAPLLGLEHEFWVALDGRMVDFRSHIHRLPVPGRRIDPGDPNAYRGDWGGTITADGREAEIATAPLALQHGFSDELLRRAHTGRSVLSDALPPEATLEGYSTHLSVAVPAGLEERVARLYAETFGPALMLLLDGPESPGLLVRPRRGRLELGGEFVDGRRLEAAAAFAAGSVLATLHAIRRWPLGAWLGRLRGDMPPRLRLEVVPAVERYGWFVGRAAFGTDLYAGGRETTLPLAGGGSIQAGDHLRRCWAIARRAIESRVDARDLDATDAAVDGREALGVEQGQSLAIAFAPRRNDREPQAAATNEPFGAVMVVRERPGFDATPLVVSWDFVVLRLEDAVATAYACLPRQLLGAGLAALDAGRLDGLLRAFLAATGGAPIRMLASADQTRGAGLYGAVGRAADLIAPEPGPPGREKRREDQRDQREQPSDQTTQPPPSEAGGVSPAASAAVAGVAAAGLTIFGLPAAAAAAIGGAAVVAVVGGVVLLGGGSPGVSPSAGPSPTATVAASQGTTPVAATPDMSGLQAAYLAFSEAFTSDQKAGNDALDAAVDAADQSAAYQILVAAYEQAIADLRAIDLPADLDPAQDDMLAALTDGAELYRRLVADPAVSDPTIDPSLRDVADRVLQAGTVIRAGLGLTPPGVPTTICMAEDAYDIITRDPGAPRYDVADWTSSERQAVLDGLDAWDPPEAFDQDWKQQLAAALVAGDDEGAMRLRFQWQVGEIHLESCGGAVAPTAGPSEAPFVEDFATGAASMSLSNSATASVTDMVFAGEHQAGPAGGTLYPVIAWADASSLNVLGVYTLTKHATGAFSTLDGTLGLGWSFENVDGFPGGYSNGIGLGHEDTDSVGECSAIIEATLTGGISGHVSCVNLNDPSLPFNLEADFTAEP